MFSRFLLVAVLLQFALSVTIIEPGTGKKYVQTPISSTTVYQINNVNNNYELQFKYRHSTSQTFNVYIKRGDNVSTTNYDFKEQTSTYSLIHLTASTDFYQFAVECVSTTYAACNWEFETYLIPVTSLTSATHNSIKIDVNTAHIFYKNTGWNTREVRFQSYTANCITMTEVYAKVVTDTDNWPLYGTMEKYKSDATKYGSYTSQSQPICVDVTDPKWAIIVIPRNPASTSCTFTVSQYTGPTPTNSKGSSSIGAVLGSLFGTVIPLVFILIIIVVVIRVCVVRKARQAERREKEERERQDELERMRRAQAKPSAPTVIIQQQAPPPVHQPVVMQPVVQQPVIQQPVIQQPVIQQPVIQQPVVQQPFVQQPPMMQQPILQPPRPEPYNPNYLPPNQFIQPNVIQ